ncbi:uncharacterized protein E0L32_004597 [Thyridium curvatum]|uniref:Uncharacterized protein n=1 Tax=Thyridium curvatum TaxID=1093900 RepID=A0A507BFJ5_9PEZI|nr:uncharacterized protein E0L32_004597 [Thyridium curvatum]TPX15320.1 hypothetical protein E0L32_004597 [Thyridium curvatum]
MGKPSQSADRPADDAVSLHTQPDRHHPFQDDDDAPELQVDDLPPLYSDIDEPAASSSSSSAAPLLPSSADADILPAYVTDGPTGRQWYLNPVLDTVPAVLEKHVRAWAVQPPRPSVRVHGEHKATVTNNGKRERKSVTDFDVRIDLTPYLFSDATNGASWRQLRTVENYEKARRGTVLQTRAAGSSQDLEVGGGDKPTLAEWCHLYCASHAGLKAFSVRRRMVGFDEDRVRQKIEALVRASNYRGRVQVTFPVKDDLVEVFNACRTNRWRLTTWIFWLCAFTLLFLLTWPYLLVRTKRFEVVSVDWPFSRPREDGGKEYISLSEDQWYNLWGRALNKAILEKRQCELNQQDLIASEGAQPTFDTGSSAVNAGLGMLRAGVNAMNEVNRQLGWGYDEA